MKGAVFDWDGTLASIDEREFYCINHALTENGSNPIDHEFYVKNYYLRAYEEGTGPRMVLETALAGKGRTIIDTVYESYRKIFQATAEKATLQNGVDPLVDRLLTRQDLGVGGTLGSLEETVSQRARLVTKALGEIQLTPHDVFLVGDSWWDVRAGKKLGIRTVLVRTGFASYNDFSKENPDLTVSCMNELREILEKKQWAI
jgi:phosphoglycolate phosphatase-like HAD superfamily hydrolase